MRNYVSASVLSADMLNLKSEISKITDAGVDMLHFDVMDGIFVPNITYGLPVLEQVRKATDITLDVHLMITDPIKYVGRFAQCGADIISFHIESKSNTLETVKAIKSAGAKAAIAIKPDTPIENVYEYLPYLDMVLVMTVEPGFGGQGFIYDTVKKISAVKNKIVSLGLHTDIQVDGGINDETAEIVKSAGANVLVSGSWLFKSENMSESVEKLRKAEE
ncbi:MAG TPA: ribulose-phosphate 3-epimerase [Ruminococcus sp.]|nr:ribulose-phosphate 3-epimerase [Ruminococcus sp.]